MTLCAYAEPRLRALVDGELPPGEASRVLRHLEQCPRCGSAHARILVVSALLQAQEPDEPPAHFSTSLQVRLGRPRREAEARRNRFAWLRWPDLRPRTARWIGGLTTATAIAGAAIAWLATASPMSASDVARRAAETWNRTRNYGCVFQSRGVYQGQPASFTQQQFFRRPGEFRLDTGQDYELTTYVSTDRIIHYLPGGDWNGRGPLVIIRPRTEGQTVLPFPFGVTWGNGGNVSLDSLIRQLGKGNTELMGQEPVQGREAYHLRVAGIPPDAREGDRYDIWVDKETFLPCRVSWYRDADNHIDTEAKQLQTNLSVFPAGTFQFSIPNNAFVVHGDVDPHVLALPFVPERTEAFNTQPVSAAEGEIASRAGAIPCPALAPHWLPDGYKLVRVRRKAGRWLDAYWMRETQPGEGQMLKLVEQPVDSTSPDNPAGAKELTLRTDSGRVQARLFRGATPYPYAQLSWTVGKTRCTLSGAQLSTEEMLHVARSISRAEVPMERAVVQVDPRIQIGGEPSYIPTEADVPLNTETTSVQPGEPAATAEPAPMMPEMPDDERAARTRNDGASQP